MEILRFIPGSWPPRGLPHTTGIVLPRLVLLLFTLIVTWTLSPIGRAANPGEGKAATGGLEVEAERYRTLCAGCHGLQRYGGYAPPLIPQTLGRQKTDALVQIILEGRPQTQMPAHRQVLSPEQALKLATWLRTPVETILWDLDSIAASRLALPPPEPGQPGAATGDAPLNRAETVLVVERGKGEVVVLEGNSLREQARFHVGRIHGGPKFTDDYAAVYASTRDGTVVRYDLEHRYLTAKVKVAVNTRNIAVSPDGAWVVAVNQLPAGLVVMDGDLNPRKVIPLPGNPSGVYYLPEEGAFVLTLRDRPLLYHLDLPAMTLRPTKLPQPLEDFAAVPGSRRLLASARGGKQILLYDLAQGEVMHSLDTSGLPHLFSATFFLREGVLFGALNHIGEPTLSIIDMEHFTLVRQFKLLGAGYFVRTHPGSPFLWADTNTDQVQLVDKDSLTLLERTLRPDPGRKAMHVEFTADGAKALLSVWHPQGAVVIYNGKSLNELERIPFNMPIGKYNARNKTHFPLH